jgi:hypothetical protein
MKKLRLSIRVINFFFLLLSAVTLVYSQNIEWKSVSGNAQWSPRDSGGIVTFRNSLWILGGWTIDTNQKFKRLNDVWRSFDGLSWERVTENAPWPVRNLPGSVVFNDAVRILGGFDGKKALNDVWSSSDGITWRKSPLAVPWSARGAFGCTVFKNKLWVMGGFDLESMTHTNDVWCSEDGVTWKQVTSNAPWSPRGMFPLVVFKDRMWIFGGGIYDQKSTNYHDVWYTKDGLTWIKASEDAGWAERRFHIIIEYSHMLWLLGGVIDGNVNMNDVWASEDGVNWEIVNKAAPWGVRHAQMCLVFNDTLWMFGGFGGDEADDKLYNDTWQLMSK